MVAHRVTLAEVAEACGVSRMTVSNAYGRPDQLSDDLRRRVLETAERLGYGGPSAVGRALKRGRSDVLGVLLTADLPAAFGDPGTVGFLHGVTAAAAEAGLSLQLIAAVGDAERRVRDAAVDGLVAFPAADDDPAVAAAVRRRLPLVVQGAPRVEGTTCVTIDNEAATASATQHLLGLGHERLGVLTWRLRGDGHRGPVDEARLASATYGVFRDRVAGVLSVTDAEVWERPGHSVADGRAGGLALLDRAAAQRLTAIVACTDVLALGVLQAAAELGLDVPGEVSVVGLDDIDEARRTGLTTVAQPFYAQGRDCAARLVSGAPPEVVVHPTELVVRTSTGEPS